MKRLGILTFHKSINYGAFMQMYSLYTRLKQDFPELEVEVIDYTSKRIQNKYSCNALTYIFSSVRELRKTSAVCVCKATLKNTYNVIFKRGFLKKRQTMRKAFNECLGYVKLSDKSFCTDNFTEVSEYISKRYDIVVVGSDCVWEFNNYPFPNIYFLHDVTGVKKLSYAACAQGILYKNLSEDQKKYLADSWRGFDYLGVRDTATEALVAEVDKTLDIRHNCDPTLFLDLSAVPVEMSRIREKFRQAGVDLNKPVIGLMGNEYVGKLCRDIVGNEYQIAAIYEENPYADFYINDLTPFEWSRCFSLFDFVFTNKFHGTIFSLKNNIPVFSFDYFAENSEYSNNGMTKLRDLYERIGLKGEFYHIGKKKYSEIEISELKELFSEQIKLQKETVLSDNLSEEAKEYTDFYNRLTNLWCF
ncbi:MAG: polysaccharide pyruvyl transferase family protein [Clostridia bacterium]|nr:polysaccharide pyruvyl transferase family protein [Clostridia bacterium]